MDDKLDTKSISQDPVQSAKMNAAGDASDMNAVTRSGSIAQVCVYCLCAYVGDAQIISCVT